MDTLSEINRYCAVFDTLLLYFRLFVFFFFFLYSSNGYFAFFDNNVNFECLFKLKSRVNLIDHYRAFKSFTGELSNKISS